MKALQIAALFAFLLGFSGCAQKDETPIRPISEIKGKPINASTTAVVTASAPAAPVAPAKSTNAEIAVINGFAQVGFDKLGGFHYIMPDEVSETNKPPADQFPPAIRALNEKPVAIRGFMLPLKIDQGLVTEMLIMKDQSACCYGGSPKINEWISVKMNAKGVKPVMDQPVTLFGKLHVGEMREGKYLVGIYQLDGEKMEWE